MRAKTEEMFYRLMWMTEPMFRPTLRNMTESFEAWAYRNGLLRQLQRLEQQKWLESQMGPKGNRVYRLTEAGRLRALGGRDPEERWQRRWDGRWRVILFDIPEAEVRTRRKLRYYLHSHSFGCLQRSAWITPDPVTRETTLLADGPVDVRSLLIMESRPCAGESDADIVAGAWDQKEINKRYATHQALLDRRPRGSLDSESRIKAWCRWLEDEKAAWTAALRIDPLLPSRLLPEDYAGQRSWKARVQAMREAGERMLTMKPKDPACDK